MNRKKEVEYYNFKYRLTFNEYNNRLRMIRCYEILRELSKLKLKNPKIIDLGCGSGWLTNVLGLFGPTIGVDYSEEAIKLAKSRYAHVSFIHADILNWDYPKKAFDVVISQEVIEHFWEQHSYINVAYDLLDDGGYIILTTPNKTTFYSMPEDVWKNWSNQPIENWLNVKELKKIVGTKFKIMRTKTIIYGYGNKGIRRVINSKKLYKILDKFCISEFYEALIGYMGFGLHILIVGKKTKT